MKDILGNNEAVTSEAAGAAYVENFALKVFMSADNDDRAGNTGK
jgi:vacuolar protein sorting-associated protein VTA1